MDDNSLNQRLAEVEASQRVLIKTMAEIASIFADMNDEMAEALQDDILDRCIICGASPMTARCNGANCDV